jgi:hypothetical protein
MKTMTMLKQKVANMLPSTYETLCKALPEYKSKDVARAMVLLRKAGKAEIEFGVDAKITPVVK